MTKLIYLYIKNIDRKIVNQEINFSNDFKVSFKQGILEIVKFTKSDMEGFWGRNVENISLLIGKNGVGKTSVLDLIGSNEKTRKYNFEKGKYFLIYHLYDNFYYFEGTMRREVSNIDGENGSKTSFYFETANNHLFNKTYLNNVSEINIYYSRNKIRFPWAGEKKVYKGNDNRLLNYIEMTTNIEDVLNTYTTLKMFDNTNRAVRIEQKISYLNNPRYLSFLYEMDNRYLKRYGATEFVSNLFLTEEGKEFNNTVSRMYTRAEQDRAFGKAEFKKEYFILRILEKIFLKEFSGFLSFQPASRHKASFQHYEYGNNNNTIAIHDINELKYLVLKNILKIRDINLRAISFNLTNNMETIETINLLENRITFIEEVLIYLSEHCKINKFTMKKIDITNLTKLLYSIDQEYFKDKNNIEIDINYGDFAKNVSNLKMAYSDIFNFKFTNFSDGEFIYLNLFSNIYKYIKHSGSKDSILLLDEPDINLHPEWSRRLIYDLVELIETYKKGGKIQVIITSHSPFIVTDFPRLNISAFKVDSIGENYLISNPEFGFAANIYDLISDTFFMEASIGEFAVRKIRSIKSIRNKEKANELINKIDDIFIKKHIKNGLDLWWENDKNNKR